MSVDSILFNSRKFDWTRTVPNRITIPKGTKVKILDIDDNGEINAGDNITLTKNVTLHTLAYYRHYLWIGAGVSVYTGRFLDDIYIVGGTTNEVDSSKDSLAFFAAVDAKTVSGGGKAPL